MFRILVLFFQIRFRIDKTRIRIVGKTSIRQDPDPKHCFEVVFAFFRIQNLIFFWQSPNPPPPPPPPGKHGYCYCPAPASLLSWHFITCNVIAMPPSVFIISVVKLSSCYHVFIVVKLLSWDLPTLPWVIFISFTVKKSSYYNIIMLLSSYCYCPSTPSPPLLLGRFLFMLSSYYSVIHLLLLYCYWSSCPPSSLGNFYFCYCQVIVVLSSC